MIQGLKFDVTTDELAGHLQAKITHHEERVAFYTDKAKALDRGGAEAANFSGGDPVRALQQKAGEHQNRVDLFRFIREHLIPNETYRLDEQDLLKLEIVSRGYGW